MRAKNLSGGQRRRLDLALALVGDPDLIFLDEPTTGFDPAARRQAWSTIQSLCDLGKTVFLTTHYMDEAQFLANRVAVMRAGEIIAFGRPDEIGGRDLRPAEIRFVLPAGRSLGELPELPVARVSGGPDGVVVHTPNRCGPPTRSPPGRSSGESSSSTSRSRSRRWRTSTWSSRGAGDNHAVEEAAR